MAHHSLHADECDGCGAVFSKADDLLSHLLGKREWGGCPLESLEDTNSEPTSSARPLHCLISNSTKIDENLETDESYGTGGMTAATALRYLTVTPEPTHTTFTSEPASIAAENFVKSPVDFGTPVVTPLRGDGALLRSPMVSPLPSPPNHVAATSAPPEQHIHDLGYQPQQEFDTPQSIPAWISPQWANPHPVPINYELSTPPNSASPQRFQHHIHPSTPFHSFPLMLAGPPAYPQRDRLIRTQQVQSRHSSAFSASSEFEHQLFAPQLPSQSFAGTIDPRLLHGSPSETLRYDSVSPIQTQNTETEPQNTPPASLTMQSLALPLSIFEYGFQRQDFDPQTVYTSSLASRDKFKPFPPDLQEEHIFNADPKQICYGNLLRIATKYSNPDIVRKVNEGRPRPVLKSFQLMESRIRSALSWKADQEKPEGGLEAVKDWFEVERAKHGVSYRRKKHGKEESDSLSPGQMSSPWKLGKLAPRDPFPTPERSLDDDLLGVLYHEHSIDTATSPGLQSSPYLIGKAPVASHNGYYYPSPHTDPADTDNE